MSSCDTCQQTASAFKVLPCLHRVCDACLRKSMGGSDEPGRIYSRKNQRLQRAFQCPRCEAPIQIPYGGIDGFVTEVPSEALSELKVIIGLAGDANGFHDPGPNTEQEGVLQAVRLDVSEAEEQLNVARRFLIHQNTSHKLFPAADNLSGGAKRGIRRILEAAGKDRSGLKHYPAQYAAVCESFVQLAAVNKLLSKESELSSNTLTSLRALLIELRNLEVVPIKPSSGVASSLRRSFSSLIDKIRGRSGHQSVKMCEFASRRARSAGVLNQSDTSTKSSTRLTRLMSKVKLSKSISKMNRDHFYDQQLPNSELPQERVVYDICEPVWTTGAKGTKLGDLDTPCAVCITEAGDIVVCDKNNYRVQVFDQNGSFKTVYNQLNIKPLGVAQTVDGRLAISDERSGCLVFFTPEDGSVVRSNVPRISCSCAVAVDPLGYLAVGGVETSEIGLVGPEGRLSALLNAKLLEDVVTPQILALALNTQGRILATDNYNHRAKLLDRHSKKTILTLEGLKYPRGGVAVENGRWLVADSDAHTVTLFDSDGVPMQRILGPEDGLRYPSAMAYDSSSSLLVVAQYGYQCAHELKAFRLVRDM